MARIGVPPTMDARTRGGLGAFDGAGQTGVGSETASAGVGSGDGGVADTTTVAAGEAGTAPSAADAVGVGTVVTEQPVKRTDRPMIATIGLAARCMVAPASAGADHRRTR